MMHNPPHPGELLYADVIQPLGITIQEAADKLGMSRVALSRVLNKKAAVSTDLAIRLELAGVSTAKAWLEMQINYNLAQAKKHQQPIVKPLVSEVN